MSRRGAHVIFLLPTPPLRSTIHSFFPLYARAKGSRLVVTQTLSKAWGLAGIRCGLAFGNEKVIDLFNRVKAPYNVNTLTSMAACSALGGEGTQAHMQYLSNLAAVASGREKLRRALADESVFPEVVEVLPSDTNFVVFRLQKGIDAKCVILFGFESHICE